MEYGIDVYEVNVVVPVDPSQRLGHVGYGTGGRRGFSGTHGERQFLRHGAGAEARGARGRPGRDDAAETELAQGEPRRRIIINL